MNSINANYGFLEQIKHYDY